MVTIYEKTAQTFNTLGLGALLPSSCVVTEELNGAYELEMNHPYDAGGKWKRIEVGNIIVATTPKGKELFRIYRIQPTMSNITVYARHIFYDLLDNYITSYSVSSGTAQQVLDSMVKNFNYSMPFSFVSELTGRNSFSISNCNPITALLGDGNENDSFVLKFGGEILREKFSVKILPSIGTDKGVAIRYGKNLKGLTVDEDISEVVTRVFPFGKNGLAGDVMDSPYINEYPYPKIAKIENTECKTKEQLKSYVQELFYSGIDLPKVNIKVDFQILSKTVEYKNYAVLEDVQLGDIVTVINNKMEFHKKAKVISYKWDALLNKYENVELGDFVDTLAVSITSGEKSLSTAVSASTEAKQVYSLISGKVTVNTEGLYICVDNNNINDATKIFHFGTNGLRYSNGGINGTWNTVISSDGIVITG